MIEQGKINIVNPGPMCLIQDQGRFGYQHLGYTQSGACDEHAFFWANKLLNNHHNCPALEITLGPFTAIFTEHTQIAITGAKTVAKLNGTPISTWQTHTIHPGDNLIIKPACSGLRIYLAIKEGLIIEKKLDSHSMTNREKLGFNQGAPLEKNTTITYHQYEPEQKRLVHTPPRFIPNYKQVLTLHLFPSYQAKQLPEEALSILCNNEYTISPQSDRMGYRLQGEPVVPTFSHLLSEGIAFGSVQFPPDGQPIILLKERQTIGGYPKIGCISKLDCFALSQRRPGQKVRFKTTSLEMAKERLTSFYNFFT